MNFATILAPILVPVVVYIVYDHIVSTRKKKDRVLLRCLFGVDRSEVDSSVVPDYYNEGIERLLRKGLILRGPRSYTLTEAGMSARWL